MTRFGHKTTRLLRAFLLAGAVVSSSALYSACTVEAPVPTESTHALPVPRDSEEPCLGEISYPDLNMQPLTLGLPLRDVLAEFVQTELLISRGPGACEEWLPSLGKLPDGCQATAGAGESTLAMLWSIPDELTEAMFASGADGAVTELVTGYVESTDHPFMFRTTAWRFPEGVPASTPALKILKACEATSASGTTITLMDGNEPAVIAFADERTVYLYEGIRPVSPEGEEQAFPYTTSGLLPADTAAVIAERWRLAAPSVFEVGTAT